MVIPPTPPPVIISAPIISSIVSSNITLNSAVISWNTDKNKDTQIEYGTSAAYGQSSTPSSVLGTIHSGNITGLIPNTTYYYRVKSKDASNDSTVSTDQTFTTLAVVGPTTTPPVVTPVTYSPSSQAPTSIFPSLSFVYSSLVTYSSATITWTTANNSDSQVDYGSSILYGQSSPIITNLTTSHSVLLSNLQPKTIYHYQVKSRDTAGIQLVFGDQTFVTAPSVISDFTAPVLSLIIASVTNPVSATVQWVSNEAASSQIEYGLTSSYGQFSTLDTSLVYLHSILLTQLTPNSLYHFKVKSVDGSGNTTTSADNTFSTTVSNTNSSVVSNSNQLTHTLYANIAGYSFEILSLQDSLYQQGYLPVITNPGVFNISTRTALQKFQCAKGIVCSGNENSTGYGATGPKTRAVLNSR